MDDYHIAFLTPFTIREYVELLKQLSPEAGLDPDIDDSLAFHEFSMEGYKKTYLVISKPFRQIVGAASVVFEPKLNRQKENKVSYCGHIEDVVIDHNHRGKGIGKYLINFVVEVSRFDCYKLILDCSREKVGFYEKCGFEGVKFNEHEVCMRINLS